LFLMSSSLTDFDRGVDVDVGGEAPLGLLERGEAINDNGALEQALQMRRWRRIKRLDAGDLMVQFYTSSVSCQIYSSYTAKIK
jgi:hypothetical protein